MVCACSYSTYMQWAINQDRSVVNKITFNFNWKRTFVTSEFAIKLWCFSQVKVSFEQNNLHKMARMSALHIQTIFFFKRQKAWASHHIGPYKITFRDEHIYIYMLDYYHQGTLTKMIQYSLEGNTIKHCSIDSARLLSD